ncbi:MAG: serine hydrolase [Pyrinomonas sp.]|uniref:serine hydrolase domain-containing protein n=1 Tax=Pyrinomonas sp. TaxID=2080306 RepID=UPI003318841B
MFKSLAFILCSVICADGFVANGQILYPISLPRGLTGVATSSPITVEDFGGVGKCCDRLSVTTLAAQGIAELGALPTTRLAPASDHGTKAAPPSQSAMSAAADYSKAHNGQALIVMFDGKVVFERYDNGGAPNRLQMLASGSKSFVGVAAVAAVQDGLLRLDDPASESIAEWKTDPKKAKITYRQLLTLTSGLLPGERGSAIQAPSWKEIIAKPMTGQPGEQFEYGHYQLNAFAYALERKLGRESFEAYLKRRILDPLGIEVEWRFRCADGHPQVGGGAFMTAMDWAKFGEFIRRGGQWNGKQIVRADLLAECFRGTPQNPAYGLTWWLKKEVTTAHLRRIPILAREWGEIANANWLPGDLVAACGAGKQRLYVIPSLKLVIVRMGGLGRGFSDAEFLSLLFQNKAMNK